MQAKINRLTQWLVPIAALITIATFLYIAPPGILGKADAVGYAICHRIDARSFQISERQLPMCARDTGTFTSAALTILLLTWRKPKRGGMPAKKIAIALAIFFLAWAIDGSNSYLYLIKETYPGAFPKIPNIYIPNNTLRLLTGTGMGMGMGSVLYAAINQSIWKDLDMRPALENGRDLGLLIATVYLAAALILLNATPILYIAAFFSVFGAMLLLSLIFSVIWMMLMRQENSYSTLKESWVNLLAGFTLALIMIIAIDLLRFSFTGTWGAIPMG